MRSKKENRDLKCDCGGYHFPHRKGSGLCHTNPDRDIVDARKRGDLQALADIFMERPGKLSKPGDPCPF